MRYSAGKATRCQATETETEPSTASSNGTGSSVATAEIVQVQVTSWRAMRDSQCSWHDIQSIGLDAKQACAGCENGPLMSPALCCCL